LVFKLSNQRSTRREAGMGRIVMVLLPHCFDAVTTLTAESL
jgi:hypothetical protein